MIYCVEDDASARELMIYTLNSAGYTAVGFGDAPSFFKAVAQQKPELVLLDIMLPDTDGLSILKKLKTAAATRDIPVIMETAKGSEYDKVIGLDSGADDYLTKPFGMMEMVSRVRAVLRRSDNSKKNEVISVGGISIDLRRHGVLSDGQTVSLTVKEYELLKIFMQNTGAVFTRDELLNLVWGEQFFGETRTVDVHIGTLRTKLGENGKMIETVRGVGYRMENKYD